MKVGQDCHKNPRIIHYTSNRTSKDMKGLVMLVGEAREEIASENKFMLCGRKNQFKLYSCKASKIRDDPTKLNIFFYLGGENIFKMEKRAS